MELLLLSQFNLDSQLPTFFEIYAKERLVGTLADAFRFAHASLADRSTRAALLLPYNTEIFIAFWTFMERAFISNFDATFSENFFGIKRAKILPTRAGAAGEGLLQKAASNGVKVPSPSDAMAGGTSSTTTATQAVPPPAATTAPSVAPNASTTTTAGTSFDDGKLKFGKLERSDKILALLSVTLMPYLKAKYASLYTSLTDSSPDAVAQREAMERQSPWRKTFNTIFVKLYPLLHFSSEAVTLLFYLLYIFKKSPHSDVTLYSTKVVLRRMTRMDYMLQNAPGKRNVVLIAQMVLMAVVLGFRFLEWWGQAGNGANNAVASVTSETLPKPSAPALPADVRAKMQVEGGDREVADGNDDNAVVAGKCPVCKNDVVNPSANTISGAVGCYPCMKSFIDEQGKCPLTGQLSTERNIRRLYEV